MTAGGIAGEAAAGERDSVRGSAIADAALGAVGIFMTAAGERSDGWIPVRTGRGPADTPLDLAAWETSARAQTDIGRGVLAVRAGYYDDERGAGLDGANARARGTSASATYAAAPDADHLGWRAQLWLRDSDLRNSSVSVAPGRAFTTPANDQYATPAFGWGANAAVRGEAPSWEWELGADARFYTGEDREHFFFSGGAFQRNRVAGGDALVAGLYGEATWRISPWIVTGGVRFDYWSSTNAHRVERDIATGTPTLGAFAPDRDGTVPTARLGARRNLSDGFYVRSAAYAGFRPPTLNELHRPFRVGNDITEANPGLKPERLYGAELAVGGDGGEFSWEATAFYNVVEDAIANVTILGPPVIHFGSVSFPVSVPPGGTLRQRQNAGRIDAVGLEAEATRAFGENFQLRLAADLTSARVDGGDIEPQLTGKRPAQAPRVSVTGGADWRAGERLSLHADVRYEGARFDDDLNTRRLDAAFVANARADFRLSDTIAVYAEALNLFDADVETALTAPRAAGGVASLDQPRTLWIGIVYGL